MFKTSMSIKNDDMPKKKCESSTTKAVVCHDKENEAAENIDILEIISTNMKKTIIRLDYTNNQHNDEVFSAGNISSELIFKNSWNDGADSFILKLLNDPCLSYLFNGLEMKKIANIIENSLVRLKHNFNIRCTKDTDTFFISTLHDIIKEERSKFDMTDINDSSQHETFRNAHAKKAYSGYYCNKTIPMQNQARKLCEMLVGVCKNDEPQTHQYESINCDPIYEEINETPPPLPVNPPPMSNGIADKCYKPMFLGATKHDILHYLLDAKDRIIAPEESYTFKFLRRSTNDGSFHPENLHEETHGKVFSIIRDCTLNVNELRYGNGKCIASIERNDSGVGSETSKTSRTKYQIMESKKMFLCEDCGMYFDCK